MNRRRQIDYLYVNKVMDGTNKLEEPTVPYGAITSLDQLDLFERYSYADYFRWKFKERVELLKDWVHKMSPVRALYIK